MSNLVTAKNCIGLVRTDATTNELTIGIANDNKFKKESDTEPVDLDERNMSVWKTGVGYSKLSNSYSIIEHQ